MAILLDLLTMPILGPPRMVHWLARAVAQEVEGETLDEGRVRRELAELQGQYEAGTLEEAEYDSKERALLEHLSTIRRIKTGLG